MNAVIPRINYSHFEKERRDVQEETKSAQPDSFGPGGLMKAWQRHKWKILSIRRLETANTLTTFQHFNHRHWEM